MDWITGIKNALEYIEDHLTDTLDYSDIAGQAYSSEYNFQRVFSILFGMTLGEYIRNRRLSKAGEELMVSNLHIIDIAIKYGYESADGFSKAFKNFHGVLPSEVKNSTIRLKSFTPLNIKISLEGGIMKYYRIEEKTPFTLIGYTKHFEGSPDAECREKQECDFFIGTRQNQELLRQITSEQDLQFGIIENIADNGYDFSIAVNALSNIHCENFRRIDVCGGTYVVFETEHTAYPTQHHIQLRKDIVCNWLPGSNYELDNRPEIIVYHWDMPKNDNRYIELLLPIKEKS
jgi:AraC family transcriptional regulator